MQEKSGRQTTQKTVQKNRRRTGAAYEQAAGFYLEQLGYEILQYNYRCRSGEIDIIAKDGETLVIPFPLSAPVTTRTFAVCVCWDRTISSQRTPSSAPILRKFSITASGRSPLSKLKFIDAQQPSLTPPRRVENPCRMIPVSLNIGYSR